MIPSLEELRKRALSKRPTPASILELRRAILIFGLLFVLWWIIEFLDFAGRTSIDPLDIAGVAILAAGGWLVLRAWQTQCLGCGNQFFINSSLPLGVNFSSECPYCGQSLHEPDEVWG